MAERGVARTPILITPETLVKIIGGVAVATVLSYIWAFTTFATVATFEAHASDFQDHVEATTIWQLETRLEDISDQRTKLKIAGINSANRDYDNDLKKRESKLRKSIDCLQSDGKHCLRKSQTS